MRLMESVVVVMAAALAGCGAPGTGPSMTDAGDTVADPGVDTGLEVVADAPVDTGPDSFTCDEYVDTDGDTIADHQESGLDADSDGLANDHDDDSDSDGIGDQAEAGDLDLCTPPADTDGDGSFDFVDPDSDNDGVSDADETLADTSVTNTDTDGDGATDLVEDVAGTDPLDADDNPRAGGDFVFVVDYGQPPVPAQDTLVFGTDIEMADVYFVIDTSGSMFGEITNLAAGLVDVVVPGIVAEIPDVQLGVMRFEDCPGSTCPNAIANIQSITGDVPLVQAGLDSITEDSLCGGEEPYALAAWVAATGNVTGITGLAPPSCPAGHIGLPCFRPGAIPILIQIGDETFCVTMGGIPLGGGCTCVPRKLDADVISALNAIHAKYIGINSSGMPGALNGPRWNMEQIALATGSSYGSEPFVFDVAETGAGLDTSIVDAVALLAGRVPLDISGRALDVDEGPTDTVDAALFVDEILANEAGGVADPLDPGRICVGGLTTGDFDSDTRPDFFDDVEPGTIVCFDIVPAVNIWVPRIPDEPQLYKAQIQVLGDMVTVLDTREVFFLIPPDVSIEIPL